MAVNVNKTNPAYDKRIDQWQRCRDFHEGSDAVKGEGAKYLPKAQAMSNQDYEAYKTRALFYDIFSRSVEGYVGAIARKDAILKAPAKLEELMVDVTLNGIGLLEFIKAIARELCVTGRAGLLVDFNEETQRPFVTYYQAEQIINWLDDGTVILQETVNVQDGADRYTLKAVPQWREITCQDGVWQHVIYRSQSNSASSAASDIVEVERIVPSRRAKPLDQCPFIFCSTDGASPVISKPPLLGLVDVVRSHYISSAELEHGRHYSALPVLYVAGANDQDEIVVGGDSAIVLNDPQAKVAFAAFDGNGLASIEKGMKDKEGLMAMLGAAFFGDNKAGVEAAETARIRASGETSILSGIVSAVEEAVEKALRMMAFWLGADGDLDLHINRDFLGERITAPEVVALVQAYTAGTITLEMFLHNLQVGELLPPDTDIQAEAAKLQSQADADEAAEAKTAQVLADSRIEPPISKAEAQS